MNLVTPVATSGAVPCATRFSRALRIAPLYLGFAATGIGVALPGALLPAMMQRWHLQDEQAGRLFLLGWIGSSLGALLVRGSMRIALLCGSLAIVIGATGLGFCAGHSAGAWIAIYGLGLGLSMTSISLVCQYQSGSRAGTELVRLNLLWAIGACACPSLAVHALVSGNIRPAFCGLACCFAALAVWATLQTGLVIDESAARTSNPRTVFRSIPLGLILMILLITGIEASAGGWLATFAKRGGYSIAGAVAAPTCFWAGLLLSRLFWSVFHRGLTHDWMVRGSLTLMAAAAALLVTGTGASLILTSAFCLGFGIGPTYPLLLAWALRFHRSGAIFFLAGLGSACLPWLTGLISTQSHSLRTGLAVPLAATLVMLGLSLALPLRLWTQQGITAGSTPAP